MSGSLQGSYKHQWLGSTPLYNIGEQAYCLSREFEDSHPEVECSGIAGLRHRLAHGYEGTNWRLIAAIVSTELPEHEEKVGVLLHESKD